MLGQRMLVLMEYAWEMAMVLGTTELSEHTWTENTQINRACLGDGCCLGDN